MNQNKFYCEKCHYGTNIMTSYNQHLNTTLHLTGKRKERSDKTLHECKECEYKNYNKINYMNHYLNNHGSIEERKDQFMFYCDICDFGAFADSIFEKHKNTEKHQLKVKVNNIR